MRRYLLFIIGLLAATPVLAQQKTIAASDTAYTTTLKEIDVKARYKNDTERYRYNQEKFYVTTVMPYVNAATKVFNEISLKTQDPGVSRKERKQFISEREDEMRTQFEDKVKDLNITQGRLLVKLIARQTNVNIYSILREFRNPLMAIKWQTWARLNGMDLDRKYDPAAEPVLENIMYDLGYPLPASYAAN